MSRRRLIRAGPPLFVVLVIFLSITGLEVSVFGFPVVLVTFLLVIGLMAVGFGVWLGQKMGQSMQRPGRRH